MDKTQGTGLILLFIVFAGYYMLTAPSQAEIDRAQAVQDSIAAIQKLDPKGLAPAETITKEIITTTDTAAVQQLAGTFGPFGAAMVGVEQEAALENDRMKVTFTSKGGKIKEVLIKEHMKVTEDAEYNQKKEALLLMNDEKDTYEYLIPTQRYGKISTAELNFIPQVVGNQITMTAQLSDGGSIVQKYTLSNNDFNLDHALQLNGINNLIDKSDSKLKFKWAHHLDRLELNTTFEQYYTTIYFKETGEDSDYCDCRSDDVEKVDESKIEWVSHVNQFFNTSIIARNKAFENGVFETETVDADSPDLKILKTSYDIPLDLVANESIETSLYIGPNEFERLQTYGNGLEQIIPFGRSIFGSINRWVIRPAFNWLSGFIGTKGIVIIVLIFILKMLLYPLMYKMLHSQAKMGLLKPDIATIKDKFPEDKQKVQMETMKLYREYGVSPLGGCLPMALQMPIWYALFRFFPASITFRQEPFLWATDLSSYDVIARLPFEIPAFGSHLSLFTILWAVTTIIYSYYNMRHMDMSANPAMKYVQYFMPITFLFFFNTYASGLTVYMFFSNVFNILQTVITKKFVFKDEKLRKELEATKNKPKKVGGFQSKLEEAMKQQQEQAKKNSNQTAKKKKR